MPGTLGRFSRHQGPLSRMGVHRLYCGLGHCALNPLRRSGQVLFIQPDEFLLAMVVRGPVNPARFGLRKSISSHTAFNQRCSTASAAFSGGISLPTAAVTPSTPASANSRSSSRIRGRFAATSAWPAKSFSKSTTSLPGSPSNLQTGRSRRLFQRPHQRMHFRQGSRQILREARIAGIAAGLTPLQNLVSRFRNGG